MHITKNVTESLLGTLLNMPERTKDGPKARKDLNCLASRKIFSTLIVMMMMMMIRRKGLKVAAKELRRMRWCFALPASL